ncbi:PorV/PorQ family protein [candidate division KSB1 bacterium]|nr:PorV/PorQ family protein [candidate division KSB1 bacterium]
MRNDCNLFHIVTGRSCIYFAAAVLAILLIAFLPLELQAQSKTGTTIGQFLLIEPSARLTGMGNAGVASYEEIQSAFYNPGAIGRFSGYGVQFTHSLWLAGITYDYVAAALQLGRIGNLYLSVTSLNSGEIDVRTVEQPLGTGERYSVSDIALGVGFGRQLTDRFSVGLQINYLQETIWHCSMSTVAFNVGTVYELMTNGVRLGASISNFGLASGFQGRDLRIQYDNDPDRYGDNSSLPGEIFTEEYPLPVLFRVGLYWPLRLNEQNHLNLTVNAFHPNDNTESISFGAEWTTLRILALRAGYQNLFLQDSETGLTLGVGLKLGFGAQQFQVDYGWADYGRLENTQRFSIGFNF